MRGALALMLALMLMLVVGGSSAFLIHLQNKALEAAEANTQAVARLLDEHLSRTLSSTDGVLRRAAQVARAHMQGKISSAEQIQELLVLQDSLVENGGIAVINAGGEVLAATSADENVGKISLGDRDWFRKLAAGQEMAVGQMVTSRVSKTRIFTVSRRVSDDDGNFLGVVVVGINVEVFTDFHKSLVLGTHGYVSANVDGMVMLRQPDPESYVGASVQTGKVAQSVAMEPTGTSRTRSPLDGVDRLLSYRTLAGYNSVVVIAAMAMEDVLEPWRHTASLVLIAVLVVILSLAALAGLVFRGLVREDSFTAGLEKTIRERTEEAEHRAEEARQANESKTRFLAAASHDLRQPLQAAGMFAEVLASQLEAPAQIRVVDKLRQSIEATNSLLTTLLDVSSLEAGKTKPHMSTFRLMPLLAGLVEQMEPEASARGLFLRLAPTSAVIHSDPVLLERLLRNLLVNAIRYTETGGVLVGCRLRGASVAIQVCDSGIGIPADKIQAVFEDFTRIEGPADRRGGRGLGLGLGVVRRMAALLGHRLELTSTPGKGSCFGVVVGR